MRLGLTLLFAASALIHSQYIPSGVRISNSATSLDEIEWQRLKNTTEPERLHSFRIRYPKSRFGTKALQRAITLEWSEVDKNNPIAIRDFVESQHEEREFVARLTQPQRTRFKILMDQPNES